MKKRNIFIKKIGFNAIIIALSISLSNISVLAAGTSADALKAAKQDIQNYYIGNVSSDALNSASDVSSLVKLLNDPYSEYFTKEQYEDFTNAVNNSFAGIGVQIQIIPQGVQIVHVYDNTPASQTGLKEGDIITQADNHSLAGMTAEEATSYLKGNEDTVVHIVVIRDAEVLNFDVTRKQIELPTVEGKLLDNHIGYIGISVFGENTATEFKAALDSLMASSADSYIIDLRSNPGGYMDAALDIAGYFIGDNTAIKLQPKNGQFTSYNAIVHQELINKPVIFLINENSASASEILSAAVKDYKKASFIGEKTYGKGVAQTIFNLPDDSYLKLTVLRFISPLGNEINKVGIAPDLQVKDDDNVDSDSLKVAEVLFNNLKVDDNRSISIDKLYGVAYSSVVNAVQLKTQKAINTSREATEALRNTDAVWAIGEFSKQADKVQQPFLVSIVDSITKAQQTGKQADINAAKASIDPDLPQVWKNSYSSAIDLVQQRLMKQLLDANEKAVSTKLPEDQQILNNIYSEIKTAADPAIAAWAEQVIDGK